MIVNYVVSQPIRVMLYINPLNSNSLFNSMDLLQLCIQTKNKNQELFHMNPCRGMRIGGGTQQDLNPKSDVRIRLHLTFRTDVSDSSH